MAGISSIASNPAVRSIVDRALLAGESPNAIATRLGETLALSKSSLYRYARGKHSPLRPEWLAPDTKTAEVVDDLEQVRRDLSARYERAGTNLDAARLSRELRELSADLRKQWGVPEEADEFDRAVYLERAFTVLGAALQRLTGSEVGSLADAIRNLPSVPDDHQQVAADLADDLDTLAARNKENR